jgi:hypothetical protein
MQQQSPALFVRPVSMVWYVKLRLSVAFDGPPVTHLSEGEFVPNSGTYKINEREKIGRHRETHSIPISTGNQCPTSPGLLPTKHQILLRACLVARDPSGIPACSLGREIRGRIALGIPTAPFGCTRGAVSLLFLGSSQGEVSTPRKVGKEFPVARANDASASQLLRLATATTPPPKSPASLRRARATHPPRSSSLDYPTRKQSCWSSPTTSLPPDLPPHG